MIHASNSAPSCSVIFNIATLYPIFTTKIISYFTIFGCFLTGLWYSFINSEFELIPPILAFSFLILVLLHSFLALFAIQKNNLFFMYFYIFILVLFQIFNFVSFVSLLIFKLIDTLKAIEVDPNEDSDIYKLDKYDHSLDNNIDLQVNISFLQILSVRTLIFINFCLIIFGFWYLSVLNHCLNKMKALQKIKTANIETKEMLV